MSDEKPHVDLHHTEWHHAVNTRDVAYDGVFVVALTSTLVYCRPVCPSRLARPEHRRFFTTWQAANAAGYRPCRRCRPDVVSGQAPLEAVQRLASVVANRITDGALNAQSVPELAAALGTSDRHIRRALKREHGTTPARLALAQRLRAATTLLADPNRSITDVAFASGFGSVRRFNAAFRGQFQMSPTAWRRMQSP
ncbi:MAG: methylphosphotriester-DNA--protein-cysteine methyltransferase family protein [Gemmatimonadaceae bacterium]|nr:methylphosphotriester-DNA--protein-cysteine methyltransferase family protein [Gemmatimonadaceae bacterium]